MIALALRRLATGIATLVLVAILVFFAVEALPGDACTAYLGRLAIGPRLANCRADLGLDRPVIARFAAWGGGALGGDLGMSLKRRQSVVSVIGPRLRNTLALGALTATVAIPLAVGLGVVAGLRRERWPDLVISGTSLVAMTVPDFVSATVLVLVGSVWLGWLPGIVTTSPSAPLGELVGGMVLPGAALLLVSTAHVARMVRTSVIEVLASDYIEMARLKGVPARRLVIRHILPNALVPSLHLVALTVGWMLSGVVVIEVVFNYPGLGRLMVDAVSDRDLPVVQALALILATVQLTVSLAADLATLVLNPRLRESRR